MPGLLGKKIGMTSIFTEDGRNRACTLVEVGPCDVTQIRTVDIDGYEAVQIAYAERKEKNVSAAVLGHYKKAGVSPKMRSVEVDSFEKEVKLGDTITVSDVFAEGEFVDVISNSKGKGFQGVVKRYNFGGVGQATHGQHNRLRAPGAIGACATPSRVFKGMRMGGRTGGKRVKVQNLEVLKIISDKNLLLVNGSIPGAKNSYILLEK